MTTLPLSDLAVREMIGTALEAHQHLIDLFLDGGEQPAPPTMTWGGALSWCEADGTPGPEDLLVAAEDESGLCYPLPLLEPGERVLSLVSLTSTVWLRPDVLQSLNDVLPRVMGHTVATFDPAAGEFLHPGYPLHRIKATFAPSPIRPSIARHSVSLLHSVITPESLYAPLILLAPRAPAALPR